MSGLGVENSCQIDGNLWAGNWRPHTRKSGPITQHFWPSGDCCKSSEPKSQWANLFALSIYIFPYFSLIFFWHANLAQLALKSLERLYTHSQIPRLDTRKFLVSLLHRVVQYSMVWYGMVWHGVPCLGTKVGGAAGIPVAATALGFCSCKFLTSAHCLTAGHAHSYSPGFS